MLNALIDFSLKNRKASFNPFLWGQLVFSSKVELGYKRSCHGRHACRHAFGFRAG
jgi:hypothetical protein